MTSKRIMFIPGDVGGCGYYRNLQIAHFAILTNNQIIRPMYSGVQTLQNANQDITFTQRVASEKGFQTIKKFKDDCGCKLVIDYDDLVWSKDKLHTYNMFINQMNIMDNYKSMEKHLSEVADLVTVTNEYLKNEVAQFIDESKIIVVPNMLSMNDWLFDRTTMIPNEDVFFYAGSLSHYNNKHKQHGDFSIPFANYLSKHNSIFMGDEAPWFMNTVYEYSWVDLAKYAKALYQNSRYAKFTIAPLSNNVFNRSKSDLKLLESCAIGRVCLVSDFEGSPYANAHPLQKIPENASIKDIEQIVKTAKENYAEILNYQYEYLNGRWLDTNFYLYENIFSSI